MIVTIEIDKPADAIIISAPYAPAGPIVIGTSHTMHDVEAGGDLVFAMDQAGLGWQPGMRVRASAQEDLLTYVEGVATAFDGVNLTIATDIQAGYGLHGAWNINITGQPGTGAQGPQGVPGPIGPPGPTGPEGPQGPPGAGSTIDEAPSDGNAYGRRNATWTHVLMYTGDVLDGGNF